MARAATVALAKTGYAFVIFGAMMVCETFRDSSSSRE
jgi:hypothetical protein